MRRVDESYRSPRPEIENIKEKSRHQIFADGGDQKKHEENLTCENVNNQT
jgi:hypothetical protein